MPAKPPPPDHERCRGIYSERTRDPSRAGQRCIQAAGPSGYCAPHRPLSDEERCTGHLSPTHPRHPGERCPCPALPYRNVCAFHGGKSPKALEAAERRRTEEKARRLVDTYGRKVETTAVEALLEEVQWTAGHVAWLRERVQAIEATADNGSGENPLVWGTTRRKTGGEDWGETEEAAPNIWLKLYQQERNHLVKVCAEAIRAGIEERRVRLAEQQGALVAQAIRAILDDLGLSPDQQAKVPEIVPRHLRALSA